MTEHANNQLTAQQAIEKNFRWNFVVNSLDGANFWFGMSFISTSIILPLYISHFTANPLLIGLIPFLYTAGVLVPQLFVANVVEQAPRKKRWPVTYGFFLERVPLFLMVPAVYFLAADHPELALISFFVLYAWQTIGTGIVVVGWQDMIAKIIPVERRGRFFGITNFLGNGAGILGALAVPFILERFTFPSGYVIAFGIASVFVFLSWVFLAQAREPAVQNSKPPVSQLAYLRNLPEVLRQNRNFRMYLLAQIVFSLSGMATGFLAVYTTKTWSVPDAVASGFTVALQVGLALANLAFGFFSDRKGHKLTLEIALVLSCLSIVLALAAPSPEWFFLVFFLRGAVNAGTFIAGISIVYEFTDAENRATYIGLANTLPGLAGAIAPLFGGWLAGAVSYQALFTVTILIGIASWILMHFFVREPRKAPEPLVVSAVPVAD